MTTDKAIIIETTGADPKVDRMVRDGPSGKVTIVNVADSSQIVGIARELVDQGAGIIELCGGIPVPVRADVRDAIGDRAMVSSVTFGLESIVRAAAYNAAFMAGGPTREAYIVLAPGADVVADRVTRAYPGFERTLVFAPDETSAATAAAELAASEVGLIEIYGGFSTRGAADLIIAVDGKAPVGVGSFAYDSAKPVAA